MNERDTSVLVGLLGVFVLWMSASSQLFRFVRPGMRPYALLAGAALVITSVTALAWQARRARAGSSDHDHADKGDDGDDREGALLGRPRIVALIALPVVVGLVIAPGALGSWAAGRDRAAFVRASFDFDGVKFLTQHAHDRTPPHMRIADFTAAAGQARARPLLAATPVRLEGFIAHYNGDATLNRFFIACCVADAALVSVRLQGDFGDLTDDSWVDVVARLDEAHSGTAAAVTNGAIASIDVLSLRHVGQPAKPYEYLYG